MLSSVAQGLLDILTITSMWDAVILLLCALSLFVLGWIARTVVYTPLWAAFICLKGSKTFFFASMFYPLTVRNRIFIFYAFARLGDDLIDDYKGEQRERNLLFLQRILDFWYSTESTTKQPVTTQSTTTQSTTTQSIITSTAKESIYSDLESMLSAIPILPDTFNVESIESMIQSLDSIISDCSIPRWAFELLLYGFKMDTECVDIRDEDDLLTYCICVASSIGMVCTCLYQDGTMKVDETLLSNAASLGIAFQLTNISRDIITDLVETNKIYVPQSWMDEEQCGQFQAMLHGNCDVEQHRNGVIRQNAARLIGLAEVYYADAWEGIEGLPRGVQFAIYSALLIYREIGMGILREKVYPTRSFTTLKEKMSLISKRRKPLFVVDDAVESRNRAWEMLQRTIETVGTLSKSRPFN